MLPTSGGAIPRSLHRCRVGCCCSCTLRSEEHTSELQSRLHLVCRLLLEKKKKHASRRNRRHPTSTASICLLSTVTGVRTRSSLTLSAHIHSQLLGTGSTHLCGTCMTSS